jgi:hypothetical protein
VKSGGLRTVLTAITIIAAVLALSLLAQVAALGRQNRTDRFVIGVIGALEHYRESTAAMTIGGRRLTAVCRQHFGDVGHIARVTLDNGATLVKVGDTLEQPGRLAADEFELAGCPRPLMELLTRQLRDGRHFDLSTATVAGRRRSILRVPGAPDGLELTIDGATPTRLTLRTATVDGTSEVSYRLVAPTPWMRLPPHRLAESPVTRRR